MRKFILIAFVLFSFHYSYAAFPVSSAATSQSAEPNASPFETGKLSFENMTANSRNAFEQASHTKLNFFERLALRSFQKKANNSRGYSGEQDTEGFNVWGFLLGLFLGPIGLLASFIISKDRNFRRWTWWGFRLLILIASVVILI
jgi:hypothetical protein